MSAQILDITQKMERSATALAQLEDFAFTEGALLPLEAVRENSSLSLYCLDHRGQRAIFVETPPAIDIARLPFYYQAQFEHAQRLVAVPYAEFHALADAMARDQSFIFIYMTARCGSTLLSHAFNETDSVLSYSEPDVFTSLVGLREPDGSQDELLTRLLRSCVLTMSKPSPHKQPRAWAFKFRGYCIELGDLFHRAFPQARRVFLYRNALDWMKSYARAFGIFGGRSVKLVRAMPDLAIKYVPLLKDYLAQPIDEALWPLDFAVLTWLSIMQRYMALWDQGITMQAVRYEELNGRPEATLNAIFDYCGVPTTQVAAALAAYAEDSQQGTTYAWSRVREKPEDTLTPDHLTRIRQLIQAHPRVNTPDFLAPGTWLPETL